MGNIATSLASQVKLALETCDIHHVTCLGSFLAKAINQSITSVFCVARACSLNYSSGRMATASSRFGKSAKALIKKQSFRNLRVSEEESQKKTKTGNDEPTIGIWDKAKSIYKRWPHLKGAQLIDMALRTYQVPDPNAEADMIYRKSVQFWS